MALSAVAARRLARAAAQSNDVDLSPSPSSSSSAPVEIVIPSTPISTRSTRSRTNASVVKSVQKKKIVHISDSHAEYDVTRPSGLGMGIYDGRTVHALEEALEITNEDLGDEVVEEGEEEEEEAMLLEELEEPFDFSFTTTAINATPTGRPRKKRKVDVEYSVANPEPVLSKFVPEEGHNICRLNSEQVTSLSENLVSRPGVVVSLKPEESLMISGTALISPLSGSLQLFLSTLSPSSDFRSYPLFAPLSHPLPTLTASPSSTTHTDVNAELEAAGVPIEMLEEGRIVFMLQDLRSGIEAIDGGALQGMGKIWPEGKSAFGLNGCHPILTPPARPVYPYHVPQSWETALSALPSRLPTVAEEDFEDESLEEDKLKPLVALVKGPKRSGKSTLSREIVNRLFTRYEKVAYLDCDLGQSEFGPGGTVGLYLLDRPLLGPSFTHPLTPARAHFLGSLNPRLDSDSYLASIENLIEHYRYELQYPAEGTDVHAEKIQEVVPLVVNTQGWVKGLGAELLDEIERMCGVTHNFNFVQPVVSEDGESESEQPRRLFDGEDYSMVDRMDESHGIQLQVLPPNGTPLVSRYSPVDLRLLSTLSAFHSISSSSALPTWDFWTPLAARPPLQVDLTAVIKEIYITGEGSEYIQQQDLDLALSGSIVGLLARNEVEDVQLYSAGRSLPSPASTEVVAFAFIRAVSTDLKSAQLITCAGPEMLSKVSGIVRGELEMPIAGILDWRHPIEGTFEHMGVPWDDVPFINVREERGVGMGKKRWRRNIMRRGHAA